ncbi:MAG: hypothetical protein BGO68_03000 [Candidatus Amoebophilus sp. 36-38]|nr:MAG: hypothetical protein BGO68_03000 [Candidatus Amoebophilus sp. 36-38]
MPFALKLFRINFQNTYYTNQAENDFHVIPDEKTKKFMHDHNMRLISYRGMIEMMWLTTRFENPLQVFEQKIANHHLNFYVEISNPHVFSFSLLTIDPEQIYYFSNSTGSQKLHQKDYVSEEDKVSLQRVAPIIGKSLKNIFGIINIQLDKLWKGKINIEQLPIEYTIQIKARETIWSYQIVDLHNRIKVPAKVVIDTDDSYFIYKGTAENKHIHLYESIKPIALRDKINQTFSLTMYPESSTKKSGDTNQEEVVLERLPLPDVSLSQSNMKKGGVFYSNVVVYV